MLPSICAVSTLSLSDSKLQAPNLCMFHVWEFTQVEEDVSADVSLWFMKVMFRDFFFFLENKPLVKCCEMFCIFSSLCSSQFHVLPLL